MHSNNLYSDSGGEYDMSFLGLIATIITVPLLVASCAISSLPPESSPVIPKASQLKPFHKVALSVPASELKVRYTGGRESILLPLLAVAAPFIGLIPLAAGALIEPGIRASGDKVIKGQLQGTMRGWSINEQLSRYTIEEISKGTAISHLDAAHGRNPSQLASEGYNGLIEIVLDEIYFQSDNTSDKVRLFLKGTGTMRELPIGPVLWKREELVAADQSQSISEYKGEQGRLLKEDLNNLLHTLSFRLACDLVYAQ